MEEMRIELTTYMNIKVRSRFQTAYQNLNSVMIFTGDFNGTVLI